MKKTIQFLYNDEDYNNAEPEELKSGLNNIIAFLEEDWIKIKTKYEKTDKTKRNRANELLGKSLQLIRLIYKVIGSNLNLRMVDLSFINLIEEKGLEAKKLSASLSKITTNNFIDIIINKLDEASKLISIAAGFKNLQRLGKVDLSLEPKTFKLKVIDRNVYINSYLISRPQDTGLNYAFISHLSTLKARSKIDLKNPPQGFKLLLDEKKDRRFIKILNELNFKGVIKDLYFSEVKDDSLVFNGAVINKESAEKRGLNIKNIIIELEKISLNKKNKG